MTACALRRRSAFTLIEIMVGLVIFAIMMTALFASFRTGMRAYTMGQEHTQQQQIGRYAVNQVSQDLRNIYYKPESQYNVARRQQESMIDANEEGLETASGRDVVEENLPDVGPPIDLSFTGEDGGEVDQLSMVRRMPFSLDENRPLWGLARITYYVNEGNLYRAIDDITRPETDEDGNVIPKPYPPQIDKLAENCVGFDLKYGYYNDEEWLMADSWDSNASQYRNPPDEDEEDDDILNTVGDNVSEDIDQSGVAGALQNAVQQQEEQERADDLPGWVELTFHFITDPEKPDSKRKYSQTVLMYNKYSMETYLPEDMDEDLLRGARANSQNANRGNNNSGGNRDNNGGNNSRRNRE